MAGCGGKVWCGFGDFAQIGGCKAQVKGVCWSWCTHEDRMAFHTKVFQLLQALRQWTHTRHLHLPLTCTIPTYFCHRGNTVHGLIVFRRGHTIQEVGGKPLMGSSVYGVVVIGGSLYDSMVSRYTCLPAWVFICVVVKRGFVDFIWWRVCRCKYNVYGST